MNKSLLLGLLGCLIVIRFILIPVFQWQNDTVSSLDRTLSKIIEMDALLEQRDAINEGITQLAPFEQQINSLYFDVDEDSKISVQQAIEKKLSTHNITIKSIGWVYENISDEQEHWLDISLSGQLTDIVKFQHSLSEATPRIYVQSTKLRRLRSNQQTIDNVRGNIVLKIFFKKQSPPSEVTK